MSRRTDFIAAIATLVLATARAEEPPLCTDRPTKANSVCTVPEGLWQIESDAFSFTHYRDEGVTTDTWLVPNPTIKYGLDDRSDIELNWAPYVSVKTSDEHRLNGIGDAYLRYKRRLTDQGASFGASIVPYLKLPTAKRGIGNERFEGGVAMPISFALSNGLTLTLGPQIDALLDADRNGYHINLVNLVNLSGAATPELTLYGELWMSNNFEPDGTYSQYSADFAAAYALGKTLQLDIGANFGLNEHTPDMQIYTGFSTRF
ncbi:transporter [Azorhizophilus paspali]|uniref:Transporter n=1 Tax=Azorhizophilus paspali TaxID=69963 RepID=A0ABV6SPR9_AZOPA